ncbi:MAG: helix-turn-helix domain-containing protein [Mycobacterium sp.]
MMEPLRSDPPGIAYAREWAAALVGVSPDTLDRERRAGRICPKYVGTKPIYPVDELRRWLEALPSEPKGAM